MNKEGGILHFEINPIEPSVASHVETSHLLQQKQTIGFYMKRNAGLK